MLKIYIVLYLTYAIIFGAIIDLIIAYYESIDEKFADDMSGGVIRVITIFIMASFWVVFMPKFVYNLVKDYFWR